MAEISHVDTRKRHFTSGPEDCIARKDAERIKAMRIPLLAAKMQLGVIMHENGNGGVDTAMLARLIAEARLEGISVKGVSAADFEHKKCVVRKAHK